MQYNPVETFLQEAKDPIRLILRDERDVAQSTAPSEGLIGEIESFVQSSGPTETTEAASPPSPATPQEVHTGTIHFRPNPLLFLSGGNPFALAREVRKLGDYECERRVCPAVPVVVMSGVTGVGSMLAAARYMGACQTVRKPFSGEDLLIAIASALEIRRETELPA